MTHGQSAFQESSAFVETVGALFQWAARQKLFVALIHGITVFLHVYGRTSLFPVFFVQWSAALPDTLGNGGYRFFLLC